MVKRLAHWLRALAQRLDPPPAAAVPQAPAPPERIGMFLDGRVWNLSRAEAEALMEQVNQWNYKLGHRQLVQCMPLPDQERMQ